jgi:hypothetical protein
MIVAWQPAPTRSNIQGNQAPCWHPASRVRPLPDGVPSHKATTTRSAPDRGQVAPVGVSIRVVVAHSPSNINQGEAMAFQVTEVQKALKGVDYPATKEELASHAEGNGADRELVDALRGMNKDSFDGPNAVMKELKGSLTGSKD